MNARHFLGLSAIALLLSLGFVKPARALTIVPPSLEFSVKPGDRVTTKVKLFNEEPKAISVFSSTANFTAKDEAGDPNFTFEDTPTDLASWIDVGRGPFTLASGDRLEVPVTITVPKNAEPGGHYASLFFGTDPSIKTQNGGQISVRSLLGTLIILRVAGDITEQASLSSFSLTDGKSTFANPPVKFSVRIQNSGNVHVRPTGMITIKNMFGHVVAQVPVNDNNGAVLPNSYRRFDQGWKSDLTPARGFFGAVGTQWKNFAFGGYSATLALTYGANQQSLSGQLHFTMFPWQLLLVVLVVVVLIILILTIGVRQYNRMIITRAGRGMKR